jgi:hypothetical protein
MAKYRKPKRSNTLERYEFAFVRFERSYRFGINRHPWDFDPEWLSEYDCILVHGRVLATTWRDIGGCVLHLMPTSAPRGQWDREPEQIGNAWIESGRLNCSAWVEGPVYRSLVASLEHGAFGAVHLVVRDIKRRKGVCECFELRPAPVQEEDDGRDAAGE